MLLYTGTDPEAPGLKANNCPKPGYVSYNIGNNGTCYKYISDHLRQYEAETRCLQDNARLITLKDSATLTIMKAVLGSSAAIIWTGLQRIANANSAESFQWQDGSIFEFTSHRHQFNNYGGDDYCVQLYPAVGHMLQDAECIFERASICELLPGKHMSNHMTAKGPKELFPNPLLVINDRSLRTFCC